MNNERLDQILTVDLDKPPKLKDATLVLAFSGWMDGGDVSTGTVQRIVDSLEATPIAEIDPEPFYIYNMPGPMEVAALFRPRIEIEDGMITNIEMPDNRFYCDSNSDLIFFVGKEPNMRWRLFGECIFHLAQQFNVKRIVFVGSFGGTVPHTREPRLYITCSSEKLLKEMEPYGVRRSDYDGPGSFTSYLMSKAKTAGLEMVSLVAEIPGYLQGTNPLSIEATTRRLAKILGVRVDMDLMRNESTQWELGVTSAIEENEELAERVRELEREYDDELLEMEEES